MANPPNVLYLHVHDMGRSCQPFGRPVHTPTIQRLAETGVLFRQAHCCAPTCSASRAALLTGRTPHSAGMLGLAHRGWSLNDYSQHLLHTLRGAGYASALAGIQHISHFETGGVERIGYDDVLATGNDDEKSLAAATAWLRDPARKSQPWFLSTGFFGTHRPLNDPDPSQPCQDPRYVLPPTPLPDTPATRKDTAAFNRHAAKTDRLFAGVLDALHDSGQADNTLIVCTTDHGIAFPHMKCNLTDHGTGVMLILAGPGELAGGTVCDAGYAKDYVLEQGWRDRVPAAEQLYDLVFDPAEANNLAADPAHDETLADLRTRLDEWMEKTNDPLLNGPVSLPEGGLINNPHGLHPGPEDTIPGPWTPTH